MKFGAWIHGRSKPSLTESILQAGAAGLESIRSYSIEYSREVAPTLKIAGLSLLAGMHIDAPALAADWRSQLNFEELEANLELGVELAGICVGNELREGGDDFDTKEFTGKLAEGLANVLNAYRNLIKLKGRNVPLTYANEAITFNPDGSVRPETLPMLEACDIIGVNLYPMEGVGWQGEEAFVLNRQLLMDKPTQDAQFEKFESQLRTVMAAVKKLDKTAILTETGFPSAIDFILTGQIAPGQERYAGVHAREAYENAMHRFLGIIKSVNYEYNERIQAVYFYEWQDNLYHRKIWNIEKSPIHVAFGLNDQDGIPKLDIPRLIEENRQ